MKQTKRERIIENLKAQGYREVPSGSTKYVRLECGFQQNANAFSITPLFVGKAGAVRTGRTISDSWSISDMRAVEALGR